MHVYRSSAGILFLYGGKFYVLHLNSSSTYIFYSRRKLQGSRRVVLCGSFFQHHFFLSFFPAWTNIDAGIRGEILWAVCPSVCLSVRSCGKRWFGPIWISVSSSSRWANLFLRKLDEAGLFFSSVQFDSSEWIRASVSATWISTLRAACCML